MSERPIRSNADDSLYFSPRPDQAAARGSAARRHFDRPPPTTTAFASLPSDAAAQIPDGTIDNPFPEDVWTASARELACECELAESESESLAGPPVPVSGATVNGKKLRRRRRPDGLARKERQVARTDHPQSFTLGRAFSRADRVRKSPPPPSSSPVARKTAVRHRRPGLGPDQLQRVSLPPLADRSVLARSQEWRRRDSFNTQARTIALGDVDLSRRAALQRPHLPRPSRKPLHGYSHHSRSTPSPERRYAGNPAAVCVLTGSPPRKDDGCKTLHPR